jgi:hypothetical protein
VNVATEPQAAVAGLASNTTILIAPGTYRLTSTLYVNGTFASVALRGSSGNADDVVLVGPGIDYFSPDRRCRPGVHGVHPRRRQTVGVIYQDRNRRNRRTAELRMK